MISTTSTYLLELIGRHGGARVTGAPRRWRFLLAYAGGSAAAPARGHRARGGRPAPLSACVRAREGFVKLRH